MADATHSPLLLAQATVTLSDQIAAMNTIRVHLARQAARDSDTR